MTMTTVTTPRTCIALVDRAASTGVANHRHSVLELGMRKIFPLALLLVIGGCRYSPLSGERGAGLLWLPYFFWPLKLILYAWFIRRAEAGSGWKRYLGLSGLRLGFGALLELGLVLAFPPIAVVGFPLVSLLAWVTFGKYVVRRSPQTSLLRFVIEGFLLSLLLNAIAGALIVGTGGFGC